MQDTPLHNSLEEHEYQAGFSRVMWYTEQARRRGWRLTDRQLVHEIALRERAAAIREKSTLPIVGGEVRPAAYHRGQADALRAILRRQHERADKS